jgi:methylmalonyl-CoA mutase
MSELTLDLGEEFPQATRAAWEALARETLAKSGAEARTPDGLVARALTARTEWPHDTGVPGTAPFTRGARTAGEDYGINIRSRISDPSPQGANRQIKEELAGGASSVLVVLDEAARSGDFSRPAGQGGVALRAMSDVEALLAGLDVARTKIAFEAGASAAALAPLMGELQATSRPDLGAPRAGLGHDCFAVLARFGRHPGKLTEALSEAAKLAAHSRVSAPKLRVAGIDTLPYHAAGASPAQEIAITLSAGAAYLRAFAAADLSIADAARHIAFTLVTDGDFLASIAKLRAFRRAWARVLDASGNASAARGLELAAITSPRMMTARDAHTNLLRTTCAAAAAIIGGADALTVLPFTERLGPSALARRLARNTGLILAEEADLARVLDPAGGSFSFESLSENLAQEAWALFQELEREGGLGAALQAGSIQARIAAAWESRRAQIAAGELPIVGVTHFVDPKEAPIKIETAAALGKAVPPGDGALIELAARRITLARALPVHYDEARAGAPAR